MERKRRCAVVLFDKDFYFFDHLLSGTMKAKLCSGIGFFRRFLWCKERDIG